MLCASNTVEGSGAYLAKVSSLKVRNPPPRMGRSIASRYAKAQLLILLMAEGSSSYAMIVPILCVHWGGRKLAIRMIAPSERAMRRGLLLDERISSARKTIRATNAPRE